MNRTDAPAKQPKPFGVNGQRDAILPTTPSGDNAASYESGFPAITMTLKTAGGKPPKGQNMNQILFELSALGRWSSTGALNTYDSVFATAIGGYPSGAFVLGDDTKTVYRCTLDGNTANPNSVTTGWVKVANDIADILELGTAAYVNVGTGANEVPDMNSFTSGTGWSQLPNGKLLQWGTYTGSATTGTINFPVPFPISVGRVIMSLSGTSADAGSIAYVLQDDNSLSKTSFFFRRAGAQVRFNWFCIGE
ncbi:TPA: phage tail protein [Citrobacter amalonaticus]